MRRLKLMGTLLRQTGADALMGSYLCFTLLCALIIWLTEPQILTYWDAVWYCFTVASTVGFGDVVVYGQVARLLSILLSIYSAATLAIFTGVFVNYFNQLVQLRQKDSLAAVSDKLEHLPDLPREELKRLSEQIRQRIKRQQ